MQPVGRCLHHRVAAARVDVEDVGAEVHQRAEPACHGVRDVVELEVEEDVLALTAQPADDFATDAVEELHADFIVRDAIPELLDEGFDILHRVEVERHDQAVICFDSHSSPYPF